MPSLANTAKTKPRKATSRVGKRTTASEGGGRLVAPSGRPAREVMIDYPEPAKDFDAEGVGRLVAMRSAR